MYLESFKESECCGCMACQQKCPVKCISMEKQKDGFLYPVVDQKHCIHCNRCRGVCDFSKPAVEQLLTDCYYGWHRDDEIRMRSTSGAAFPAIAELCFKTGYRYIWGVVYNSLWHAEHICVETIADITPMVHSKYLQSDLKSCYRKIKFQLEKNEKVVFFGTPCQAAGLLRFLGSNRKNLLVVDLVCHGVTSSDIFSRYIRDLEKLKTSKVIEVIFRNKINTKSGLSYKFTTINFENGDQYSSEKNEYTMGFGIGLMHRECCFHCPYTTTNRISDITIGDFWGIEEIYPELREEKHKGISLILAHSQKGKEMCSKLNGIMSIQKTDIANAVNASQQQLSRPIQRNKRREGFFNKIDLRGKSVQKTLKAEMFRMRLIQRMKRLVLRIMPRLVYVRLKRLKQKEKGFVG